MELFFPISSAYVPIGKREILLAKNISFVKGTDENP